MNKNQIVGRLVALSAAIFYGFNTTLSRLAYDTGTTPVSLTFYRFLICALIMLALVTLLRKSWKLGVSPWLFGICICGNMATSIGHLGAVKYIPVSLAAIIFYTFPLIVVAYKRLAHGEAVTRNELLAFVFAFAGIATALGAEFNQLDPVGIMLAFGGALGATVFILSYERFPANTDSYVGTMWIMIASTGFACLILLAGFDLVPPGNTRGWVYLLLIALATVTAFVFSLQAISRVGGAVFALFLNFEPVIILLLAWIVIGETLTLERLVGIALIVFALFFSHWNPRRSGQA